MPNPNMHYCVLSAVREFLYNILHVPRLFGIDSNCSSSPFFCVLMLVCSQVKAEYKENITFLIYIYIKLSS